MSGFGSFSQEAYQQLQEAYSNQLSRAEELEEAGVKIGKDTLGVETIGIKSPWTDRTGLWTYPDGKGEHLDVKQKQHDLLAALRDENGDIDLENMGEEEVDLSSLSDEEVDALIEQTLAKIDEEDSSDEEVDTLLKTILEDIEENSEDPVKDAAFIAEEIARLKIELAELIKDDEPEETQGEEEETESELPQENEEDPSDDEPA